MPEDTRPIRFGPYQVHPTQGLARGGCVVHVTPKALAVLYALARRPLQVITKQELFERVWPNRMVSDSALSTCIQELRSVLGDNARRPVFIETVYGRGFRFLVPDPATSVKEVSRGDEETEARADEPDIARFATARPSIVVLPFDTISLGEPDTFLARGLVHDIITRVARSRLLFIIARGTAFTYECRSQDARAIGEELGVRYVVQGAVQIEGNQAIVSVALASAESGEELWSERYRRSLSGFLELQEEIAGLIVAALEQEVERKEMQRSLLMPSSSLDAWGLYHRGIHYMYRFREQECDRADRLFRRSIALEPGVPRPHAGLSFVNFERVFLSFADDPERCLADAVSHAERSLQIDDRDPMGHWALSRAYLLQGKLDASKQSLEKAIDLNPSYAIAQYSLGWVALQLGENELCLDRVAFASRLSPRDPLKFAMLGVYALNLAMMGRTAEAAELSIQSVQQPNAHYQALAFAAVTHALDGRRNKAREFLQRIQVERPNYGIDEFLSAYRFQRKQDIERLQKAFRDMERPVG